MIEVGDQPVAVADVGADRHPLQYSSQPSLPLLDHLFRPLAGGNVLDESDEAIEASRLIAQRRDGDIDPDRGTVGTQVSFLGDEFGAQATAQVCHHLLAGRPIVLVGDFGAFVADEIGHAPAGNLGELLVAVQELPFAVNYGNSHGGLAEDCLEPLIAGTILKVPRRAVLRGDSSVHVAAHLPKNKKRRGGSMIPFAPSTRRPAGPTRQGLLLLPTGDYTTRYRESQGLGAS